MPFMERFLVGLVKLMTRKTIRGKKNILIDMIFHGHGRACYLLDQIMHSLNEGRFSMQKFLRYGNARKILGRSGAKALKTGNSILKIFKPQFRRRRF